LEEGKRGDLIEALKILNGSKNEDPDLFFSIHKQIISEALID